jgi:hypothetical protein
MIPVCSPSDSVLFTPKMPATESHSNFSRSPVDYLGYASCLATVRAFHAALQPLRSGAAEAFVALPNREYCDLVCGLYGEKFSRPASCDASGAIK